MRKILLIVILLGVLYFILGFIAVQFNWISSTDYNSYATIVGGVAALCGLLTFALPKLTPNDIETLEIGSLQRVAKVAEELNAKKNELNLKASEILKLEQQKKEMEFLVRKASLSLFLQDQIERSEKRVLDFITTNKELIRLLEEIHSNKDKLIALQEEIRLSDQVELLEDIIYRAKSDDDIEIGFGGLTLKVNPFPFNHLSKIHRNIFR